MMLTFKDICSKLMLLSFVALPLASCNKNDSESSELVKSLEVKVAAQQRRIDELEVNRGELYSHTQELEKALSAPGPETVPSSPMAMADQLPDEGEAMPRQPSNNEVTNQQLQQMQARLDRVEQKANADRRSVTEMELSHGGPL